MVVLGRRGRMSNAGNFGFERAEVGGRDHFVR